MSVQKEEWFSLKIEHAKVRMERVLVGLVNKQQQYVQEVTEKNDR